MSNGNMIIIGAELIISLILHDKKNNHNVMRLAMYATKLAGQKRIDLYTMATLCTYAREINGFRESKTEWEDLLEDTVHP